MPVKKKMVATKQESMQAEKEDTTQLIYRDKHNFKRVSCVVVELIDLVIPFVVTQLD
jgi:hypothetical protein